jgi:DNA polymerase-3 subunit alpha
VGYRNLCQLLSLAHLKGFYYKPRLDKEVLRQHSEGLIALSGSLHGEIHRRILDQELDKAKEAGAFFQEVYGDRFYLEVQDHGLPLEKKALPLVDDLARELGIPLVVTNECRYLKRENHLSQMVLHCIQTGRTLAEEEERMGSGTDQRYLKAPDEIKKNFKEYSKAIENSVKISELCNFSFPERVYHFPRYQAPRNLSLGDFLQEKTEQGFAERWPQIASRLGATAEEQKQFYWDRLKRSWR